MRDFDITADYNRDSFGRFLYDFLPDDFESESEETFYDFKNIEEGFKLGTCKSLDLDIFEFRTKSRFDPRVTLTREVVSCMKKYSYNPNALVAFYTPESHSWRLSLITTDYEFVNGKIKTEHSNPRRFSFKLGAECKMHTPTAMLFKKGKISERTENGKSLSSVEDLKSRFALEVVSKQFFDEYKVFYEDFVQFITGNRYVKAGGKYERKPVSKENSKIFSQFKKLANDDYELACKYVRDYVKKFMGRLVFLQFLQKKGWLGVAKDSMWGEGNRNFLLDLFSGSKYKGDFLGKVLDPLFFGMLNTDVDDREKLFEEKGWDLSLLNDFKRIPYLNGGLFENDVLDEIKIQFPKEMFSNPAKADTERTFNDKKNYAKDPYPFTESCGLLDFFARYNFTIDETDPADMEIGVEPEMLGKIFENLLEDNKDKGAFYTPKEIVQYMCRESLIAYLGEDSRPLVTKHAADYTDSEKSALLEKLHTVKVCDPAVGSGAFPMGMLNELFACRIALGEVAENGEPVEPAEIKKQIVRENIYGVDIEKGAVDIARLRFWLAIIVDEKEPLPLPNLDYKIMQGNSLLECYEGIDLSNLTKSDGGLFSADEEIDDLTKAIDGYYIPSDHKAKQKIRIGIQKKIVALLQARGFSKDKDFYSKLCQLDLHSNSEFFLWHTWFNDVFNRPSDCNGTEGGFDIVIGNPPYIRVQNLDYSIIDNLKAIYETALKRIDISLCFIELASKIVNEKGIACFITSNQFLTTEYGKAMREFLLRKFFVKINIDLGDLPIFESAMTYVSIFEFTRVNQKSMEYYPVDSISAVESLDYGTPELIPYTSLGIDNWNLKNHKKSDIFKKMQKGSVQLDSIGHCNAGLITGCDKILMFNKESLTDLPFEKEILLPVMRAENCSKYVSSQPTKYVIYPYYEKDGKTCIYTEKELKSKFPKTYKYLKSNETVLSERKDSRTTFAEKGNWYGLVRFGRKEMFNQAKIISPGEVQNHKFCLDYSKSGFSCARVFAITVDSKNFDIKYVLAILNSDAMKVFVQSIASLKNGGYYQYSSNILNRCPIPSATPAQQKPIIDLVDRILAAKKADSTADTSSLEAQIDKLVYALYGLTEEEIAIVEGR